MFLIAMKVGCKNVIYCHPPLTLVVKLYIKGYDMSKLGNKFWFSANYVSLVLLACHKKSYLTKSRS